METSVKRLLIGSALVGLLALPAFASAQVITAPDARIRYGHHHLHVNDVAAHKKFWIDTLGGTLAPKKLGPFDVIRINGAVILVQPAKPTAGGTKGTTVNHLGIEVADLKATLDKARAAGYPIVTRQELPPNLPVKDDMMVTPALSVAFVVGPDDTLVELMQTKATVTGNHHLHMATTDQDAMMAWYAKVFGAKAGKMGAMGISELPGTILMYTPVKDAPVTTKDHVVDHIGFEVRNLPQFLKDLEASGVKIDMPYRQVLGLGIGFITDPWGTVIELTEGLDQY